MGKVYYNKALQVLAFLLFLTTHTFSQMEMDDCSAHPDDDVMHDEHCAVFALVPEDGATHISIANGSWFSTSTWNTFTIPDPGARVLIDSGFVVTYDGVSESNIDWVRVNGTLDFATNSNTKLKVKTFVIDPNGHMSIGTAASPVSSTVTAKIIFPDQGPIDITDDPFEFGKGFISHGYLTVNGAFKKAFVPIAKQINAGTTSLKLLDLPTGWQVGDVIVLPGTYAEHAGEFEDNTMYHDEELTITSISGKTVFFTNNANGSSALLYEHKFPAGYGIKMYVANLTRNVQFETENYASIPIDQRSHLMLMHKTEQQLLYASFTGMGRTSKEILVTDPVVDSLGNQLGGGSNVRGRYACHIHRAGTNNIIITPLLIQGCVAVHSTSWGFVNHESNVQIEDNIAFDFAGAGFVTESGNELGTFKRNMAVKGQRSISVTDVEVRVPNFDFGSEGNGFWMQGSNTEFEDNIATSCTGDAYKLFSDDGDMAPSRRLKIPSANLVNPVIAGADDSIYTAVIPMRKFEGCIAYNCNTALGFWSHMLNSDNVGDFSSVNYNQYTHSITTVVEGFKFWNLITAGIQVRYSGQIEFKNGTLLGDIANQYVGSEWVAVNPVGGYAFITSTITGQLIYNNLTVKGWIRGIVAGRCDDLISGDESEYNYRTGKVIGGIYNNNTYNIYPEEGTDAYGGLEYYKFPKYFEVSGSPSFTAITPNTLPVADFSYVLNGGNSVFFNGVLSSDADPGITTAGAGNGVAAYVWNFGDGTTGTGMDVIHSYTTAGTYSVMLTVYDSQGQTNSSSKNVYVSTLPYKNIIINSGFESGDIRHVKLTTNMKNYVDTGWLEKSDWDIVDGKAMIFQSDNTNRPLVQITKNDKSLRGLVEFSFQAKNLGYGAAGNFLIAEIIGVNGEFKDPDVKVQNNIHKWNNNDLTFTSTLLYSNNFATSEFNWQTFTQDVNFGSGYEYIILKFYSLGVMMGYSEEQGLDNICLPCNCVTPQDLFEDELTATHAMLMWDNVGTNQYQVQYKKTTGGTWTTVTVNNTYLELSSLLSNTSYTWKVNAWCDGAWTAYSTDKIFITPAAGTTCTSPHNLITNLITTTKATLNWEEIPGALQYQISYKKTIGGTWTNIYTNSTSYLLTSLLPATSYQWKVKAQCAAGWKNYTSTITFITLPLREGDRATTAGVDGFVIYPNPVNDILYVESAIPLNEIQIRLTNVTGQLIETKNVTSENNTAIQLNLSALPVGVYFLTIVGDGILYASMKLIRQ